MWPDRSYQVIPSPPFSAWHPRFCPVLCDFHHPRLALPCSILTGAVLFGLVQPCLTLACLALSGPVLSGPARHCLALPCSAQPNLPGAALLYSAWRCPALPCQALSCPPLRALRPHNPAGPCPARVGPPGTVRHCLGLPVGSLGLAGLFSALPDPVWCCFVLSCPALRGPVWRCPVRPARPCRWLRGRMLDYKSRGPGFESPGHRSVGVSRLTLALALEVGNPTRLRSRIHITQIQNTRPIQSNIVDRP